MSHFPLFLSVKDRGPVVSRLFQESTVDVQAGVIKACISVKEQSAESEAPPPFIHELLEGEKDFIVRIYILGGRNLRAADRNHKSDPYLRVSLGKHVGSPSCLSYCLSCDHRELEIEKRRNSRISTLTSGKCLSSAW
mmetsp:Transcript_36690/g.114566  ORF Transcript_36690/g.114566 Transcript_36690/m.114566 type:complete len:137 (+) Transcript_36690:628-1038(+)